MANNGKTPPRSVKPGNVIIKGMNESQLPKYQSPPPPPPKKSSK